MTITINKTVAEKVQLTPPLFWKRTQSFSTAIEMTGLIDDNTIVNLFISDGMTLVSNKDASLNTLEDCYNNWEPVTEDEFFAALNTAVERVSLQPVLTHKF